MWNRMYRNDASDIPTRFVSISAAHFTRDSDADIVFIVDFYFPVALVANKHTLL